MGFIFDYTDGDFIMPLGGNMGINSDGNVHLRMGDNLSLNMDTGDLSFTSRWKDSNVSDNDKESDDLFNRMED